MVKVKFFVLASTLLNVAIAQKCGSFKVAEFGPQKLVADFAANVFRVASGHEVGSAYLLDPEHGYLLTAAHVVKDSIQDPHIPIVLSHKDFGASTFAAHHIATQVSG